MKVEEALRRTIARNGAAHLTLIDPEKQPPATAGEMASDATAGGTDGIMIGGSTSAGGELLDDTVLSVKKATHLPTILFPASEAGVSRHADAVFFMSMLNSRDPYFITGAQKLGAPVIKQFGIEPLPMAYLIVEPGGAAGRVGKADLIPRDKPGAAVAYALAAQYLGMRLVYLEAGSGAETPVPVEMIRAVRGATEAMLIVGGGIRTPEAAVERVKAGADVIVTGTLVERSLSAHLRLKSALANITVTGSTVDKPDDRRERIKKIVAAIKSIKA